MATLTIAIVGLLATVFLVRRGIKTFRAAGEATCGGSCASCCGQHVNGHKSTFKQNNEPDSITDCQERRGNP